MGETNKKIKSLQAVRFIAFIIIFLVHTDAINGSFGGVGVSIFLVLSGFVMTYAYWEKEMNYSIKGAIQFSINKIKKLYPLHIVTMLGVLLLMVPNVIKNATCSSVMKLVNQVLANVLLLKAFIPREDIYFSLNGVSWYLSVCLFVYIIFPLIQNKIRDTSIDQAIKNICMLYVIQIAIVASVFIISDVYKFNMEIISGVTYVSPIFRSIDFLAGVNLCVVFKKNVHNLNAKVYTVWESILVVATILSSIIYLCIQSATNKSLLENIISRSAVMFLPISIAIVYLFAINKGLITKMMANRFFIYIGNISAYTFLIHTVVIRYLDAIVSHFTLSMGKLMNVVFAFVLTVTFSIMYKKMECFFKKTKLERNFLGNN